MVALDYFPNTNADTFEYFTVYPAADGAHYHSFKVPASGNHKLTAITVFLMKFASGTTCTFQMEVYAHGGVYGTSSVPSGAAIATSAAVTETSLSTAVRAVSFVFAAEPTLTADTAYVWVLKCSALGGTNPQVATIIGRGYFPPVHAGNGGAWSGAAWAATSGVDYSFYAYGYPAAGTPVLPEDEPDPPPEVPASDSSVMRVMLADMERRNVGNTIWESNVFVPGMWEHNTVLLNNLSKMEKTTP